MPKTSRTLLLVEDDETYVELWERDIGEFNDVAAKPFLIDLLKARNASSARVELDARTVDCAIIDLRIPSEETGPADAELGNALLKDVLDRHPFPMAVVSAHPGEASAVVRTSPTRIFTKEQESFGQVLDWLVEHESLMKALRHTTDQIRAETARVFFGSIWRRWPEVQQQGFAPATLYQIVTRQIVAHVAEQLVLPPNEAVHHHLIEFYFEPPLRATRLHTGDMIELDGHMHVILTPQCDIVRNYPDFLILARCEELTADWRDIKVKLNASNTQRDKANRALRDLSTQNLPPSKHFLPPCGARGPWMVKFGDVITVSKGDAERLMTHRFASIAPQFLPNLVQRFAAFIGRIGQPEIDTEELGRHAMRQPD